MAHDNVRELCLTGIVHDADEKLIDAVSVEVLQKISAFDTLILKLLGNLEIAVFLGKAVLYAVAVLLISALVPLFCYRFRAARTACEHSNDKRCGHCHRNYFLHFTIPFVFVYLSPGIPDRGTYHYNYKIKLIFSPLFMCAGSGKADVIITKERRISHGHKDRIIAAPSRKRSI